MKNQLPYLFIKCIMYRRVLIWDAKILKGYGQIYFIGADPDDPLLVRSSSGSGSTWIVVISFAIFIHSKLISRRFLFCCEHWVIHTAAVLTSAWVQELVRMIKPGSGFNGSFSCDCYQLLFDSGKKNIPIYSLIVFCPCPIRPPRPKTVPDVQSCLFR